MMPSKFIDFRTYRTVQILVNLTFLIVWFFANDGLAFWDDFTYLNFANQINEGTFHISNNHFTSRVGLLYPVAWIIEIFGISAYTITIFPMLCGLVILNLFFWIGYLYGHWIGLLGGFLLLVDYHMITFVTHLFPEMPLALSVFGAVLCYDFVNRRAGDHRLLGLLMALLLFAAFLIKTSILMLGPLFAFLLVNDFRKSRNKSFWYISMSLLIFFFLLHGFWYKETFGDFFYRFNNISDNHEATSKTFFDKDNIEILKRLTYLPFLGFLRGGFFIPLGFALPALLTLKKADWKLDKPEKLWPVASILILGSWWFISTNWKYYSPMPVDTRHIMFLIPFLLMSGAFYWHERLWFGKLIASHLKWIVVAGLLAIPCYKVIKSDARNFKSVEQEIESLIFNNNVPIRVFTDGLLSYGYPYFYNFEETSDQYFWFSEMMGAEPRPGDFLLVNEAYLNDRYADRENLKMFKEGISKKGWQLESLTQGRIQIFKVKE